jgi:hypothetical protein
MRPGKNGGSLKSGNARAARTATEQRETFVTKMRALTSAPATLRSIEKILASPGHRHFPAVARLAAEYSWGKAREFIDITEHREVDDQTVIDKIEQSLRIIGERQRLARALAVERPAIRAATDMHHDDDHHSPDGGA